ncbi:hypothetical protein LZ554_008280 [Drepanopeziza brunnea f. sp. 'monogermtubi']|nr:hypothetical protein LZ554_008280 [Drepanopeziza brunnea f. sp. 'monogermtubi']
MASPGIYFYEYDSRLPFMWNLAQGELESMTDGRGMTFEQANLWGSVRKTRDRVLTDERYRDSDQAIQQYILEYWVWGKHCQAFNLPYNSQPAC